MLRAPSLSLASLAIAASVGGVLGAALHERCAHREPGAVAERGQVPDVVPSVIRPIPPASPVSASARPPEVKARPVDLAAAFAGDDDRAKIDAVRVAAREDGARLVREVASLDLAREPEAAPAIIAAVGAAAGAGSARERASAVAVLARWLDVESRRRDPDAEGNVPNLVEALATAGGPDAAAAIARALDGGALDRPVETLAAQKLGELGDASARPAIERLLARVRGAPRRAGIEGELDAEAEAAAVAALSALR